MDGGSAPEDKYARLRRVVFTGPEPESDANRPRIGKYLVLREIGRGSMAAVYEAEDPDLRRRIALKVIRETDAGPKLIARLHREAAITAQMRHPNIIRIHDVGTVTDSAGVTFHYIAMDFVEGGTLADLIASRRAPRRRLLEIVEAVARAVECSHAQSVIHRDLKPANILVDGAGRAVLSDFGLARDALFEVRLTGANAVLGTPSYMAPEQVQGRAREIDARTDVYALGAILYEVLTGHPPFVGRDASEVFARILQAELARPSASGRPVESNLEAICMKALERRREDRYATAGAFADDLVRFLRGEATAARPPTAPVRGWRFARRHRTALAAAAVLAAAAMLAPLVFRAGPRVPDPQEIARLAALRERLTSLESVLQNHETQLYQKDADVAARAAEVARAVDELESAAAGAPPELAAVAWRTAGTGHLQLGDLDRAEAALLKAGTLAPADGAVQLPLARVYMQRSIRARWMVDLAGWHPPKREREIREWGEKLVRCVEDAGTTWAGMAEIDRSVAREYATYARREKGAADRCRRAIEGFGTRVGVEEFWVLLSDAGQEKELESLTRALELKPHYALALYLRATRRFDRERELARQDLEAALKASPRFPEARYLLAICLHFHEPLKAIAEYDAALAISELGGQVRVMRAEALGKLGRLDEAEAAFTETIRLHPGLAAATSLRGSLRLQRGEFEAALADFDQAIRDAPDHPKGLIGRGLALSRLGRPEEALRAFDEAVQRSPDDPVPRYQRGRVRWDLKDGEGAVADYTEAIRLSPGYHLAYIERARVHGTACRHQPAIRDLEKALEVAPPDWPHRRTVEQDLENVRSHALLHRE